MTAKGAVAAGHPLTAEAAALLLEAGGNAFDAALAALCAACVAEPVLTSLGGGGFLTARTAAGETRVYDFFVQTPRRKRPQAEIELFPAVADFGTAKQKFHIGLGALATPGTVRGLFDAHRELGTVPMRRIVEPAVAAARDGVRLNRLQAYIFSIVAPIYLSTPGARALYASPQDPRRLFGEGERMRQGELADALDLLAIEGDRLFYEGEMAQALVALCEQQGGQIGAADLAGYRTLGRSPLQRHYRNARLHLNPPPSSGGLLIAFALALLEQQDLGSVAFGAPEHLLALASGHGADQPGAGLGTGRRAAPGRRLGGPPPPGAAPPTTRDPGHHPHQRDRRLRQCRLADPVERRGLRPGPARDRHHAEQHAGRGGPEP